MWKLEIVKSRKVIVLGADENSTRHTVDWSNLPTRPRIGDVVEGYKAGGIFVAERFFIEEERHKYPLKSRFALKRDFETQDDNREGGKPIDYPAGLAFTITNFAPGHKRYNIVFDRDKRENASSPHYFNVSEHIIDELLTEKEDEI